MVNILWFKNQILLGITILLTTTSLMCQSSILLINSDNKSPIELAHIKFTAISGSTKGQFKWGITNIKGVAINPFLDSTKIEISHLGYDAYSGIIHGNKQIVVSLEAGIFGLNEMTVTAQFIPLEVQKSIYDITTLNRDRIIEKGANNLRETLNNNLHFRTNNGHANETAINLNGLSGNHVKFMIDGVPIEGRIDGNIDLSQISMNQVESIEIIEGPTSVAYGTNALGGTINIITKKNQHQKTSVGVNTYYESIGQYNLNVRIGQKIQRNLFKLSGGRNYFDGFSTRPGRYKDWKPREQYFGSFLFSRRINHLKLSFISDYFNEIMTSRGRPNGPYFVTAFDTHYKTQRLTNKLLMKGRVSKNEYIDLTLSQSFYRRGRNIYYKDLVSLNETLTIGNNDQDTTIFTNYMLRGVYSKNRETSKLNFLIGTEIKQDNIEAERVTNTVQGIRDYALFGNLRYKPHESLTIQPALRVAYNSKYAAPIIPSINLLFSPNKTTQIRGSYARGFRTPSLKELYLEFHFNSSINLFGNNQLNAENSDHINLSIDYHKKINQHKIRIIPKVFYSQINNLISLVKTSSADWTYMNIRQVTTRGLSLNIDYKYGLFGFSTAASYYGNNYSQFKSIITNNEFLYTSEQSANINYFIKAIELKLNLDYKYSGKIRSYYNDDNNMIQESSIGDFHTMDASIVKQFMHKKYTLSGGIKNIFDVKDVELVGDVIGVSSSNNATSLSVLWGRSFFLSFNMDM